MNDKIIEAIKKSGLKKRFIAEKLGITTNSLRRKLKGEIRLKECEINILYELLKDYL